MDSFVHSPVFIAWYVACTTIIDWLGSQVDKCNDRWTDEVHRQEVELHSILDADNILKMDLPHTESNPKGFCLRLFP